MRFVLRASRALISAATTTHIAALRVAVKTSDRKHTTAMRLTDTAALSEGAARNLLSLAIDNTADAIKVEGLAKKAAKTFYRAAQAEANSLRRGITL